MYHTAEDFEVDHHARIVPVQLKSKFIGAVVMMDDWEHAIEVKIVDQSGNICRAVDKQGFFHLCEPVGGHNEVDGSFRALAAPENMKKNGYSSSLQQQMAWKGLYATATELKYH